MATNRQPRTNGSDVVERDVVDRNLYDPEVYDPEARERALREREIAARGAVDPVPPATTLVGAPLGVTSATVPSEERTAARSDWRTEPGTERVDMTPARDRINVGGLLLAILFVIALIALLMWIF
ncbi:MAG TPA: hypothetical protein VNK95_19370 [Caldilineaceae bacterium]|nr:hypothetical protein [Caldilineaceae bacterium]